MPAHARRIHRFVEGELEAHRSRFTGEEAELFRTGEYLELGGRLMERARTRFWVAVAVMLSLKIVPIIFPIIATRVLEFGTPATLGGTVLSGVATIGLPLAAAIRWSRVFRSAARVRLAALESEGGPIVDGIDMTEVVRLMEPQEIRWLEEGRVRQAAERLQARGANEYFPLFAGPMMSVLALGLLGVMVMSAWDYMEEAGHNPAVLEATGLLLLLAGAAGGLVFFLVIRPRRAAQETEEAGERILDAIGGSEEL